MIREVENTPPMTIDKVAKRVGISERQLQRWMRDRKVVAPNKRVVNGQARRVWSEIDYSNLKQYKQAHYRKGCGRRKAGEQRTSTTGGIIEVIRVRHLKRLYDSWQFGQLSARFREMARRSLRFSLVETASQPPDRHLLRSITRRLRTIEGDPARFFSNFGPSVRRNLSCPRTNEV